LIRATRSASHSPPEARPGSALLPPPIEKLIAAEEDPVAAPEPAPPPAIGAEELAAAVALARAEGRAEGEAAARAELAASLDRQRGAAAAALAGALAGMEERYQAWLDARAGASRELALALARALVPRALERAPLADIEAMLRELVERLEGEPELHLALPADLLAPGRELLEAIAGDAGFTGRLTAEGDPALGPGDARLSWHRGHAIRELAAIEREALAVVAAWLPPLEEQREISERSGSLE
jgi:flagellar assembly protein FliH